QRPQKSPIPQVVVDIPFARKTRPPRSSPIPAPPPGAVPVPAAPAPYYSGGGGGGWWSGGTADSDAFIDELDLELPDAFIDELDLELPDGELDEVVTVSPKKSMLPLILAGIGAVAIAYFAS
ncbi:MAG: hypothetical protein ABH877_04410, partial [bacterium]